MLRRLHPDQPESFAFTDANQKWAEALVTKYPEGRQASAVIPLLWRGQEQEGWVTKPMIETVAKMLGMASIRVLEVASFYFMFQLKPVGSVAHFQICGTTSCMICGAEDLIAVCKDKIAPTPHTVSADGKFSWEEVECLGACSNAPMAQIGKDYYEDLTADSFAGIIDAFSRGEQPAPGPQNGRFASEPLAGLTSLKIPEQEQTAENASKELARVLADTSIRITDGRGVGRPLPEGHPSQGAPVAEDAPSPSAEAAPVAEAAEPPAGAARHWTETVEAESGRSSDARGQTGLTPSAVLAEEATLRDGVGAWRYAAETDGAPDTVDDAAEERAPELLTAPRADGADDLKRISGVGPKLEGVLNDMGIFHFSQIAAWTAAEVAWVDARLKFKGRIARDGWISQARAFAAEAKG